MSEAGEALTGGEGGEGGDKGITVESWLQNAPEGAWDSPEVFNAMLESAPDDIRSEQSLTANGRIQSVPSLLRSHVHAQKHMGGEKLAVPKDENDTEAWDAIYKTIGRPDTPQDYKIELGDVPVDETGQGLIDKMLPKLHEAGVSNQKANELIATMATELNGVIGGAQQQLQSNIDQEKTELQSEWGGKYDENMKVAKQAAQALGVDAETIDALEGNMGFAKVMKLFHTAGTKITGAGLRGGEGDQGAPSKAEAERQLSTVRERLAKFVNDNTRTMNPEYNRLLKEMSRLNQVIYGNEPVKSEGGTE